MKDHCQIDLLTVFRYISKIMVLLNKKRNYYSALKKLC